LSPCIPVLLCVDDANVRFVQLGRPKIVVVDQVMGYFWRGVTGIVGHGKYWSTIVFVENTTATLKL